MNAPAFEKAEDVVTALRRKFPPSAFAFLEQVGNSSGARCRGWADVIVMGLWPSRGLEIIGIEVKVSRTDWLRELKDPEKGENVARFCDSWFLAVNDPEIIRPGELPKSWGLMAPGKKGEIEILKAADGRATHKVDRFFIAAILRRAQEQITSEARLKAEFEAGRRSGAEAEKQCSDSRVSLCESELKGLREKIQEFEKASGVTISEYWSGAQIGQAVREVMLGAPKRIQHRLKALLRDVDVVRSTIESTISNFKLQPGADPKKQHEQLSR